jgi:hypothetical protein
MGGAWTGVWTIWLHTISVSSALNLGQITPRCVDVAPASSVDRVPVWRS